MNGLTLIIWVRKLMPRTESLKFKSWRSVRLTDCSVFFFFCVCVRTSHVPGSLLRARLYHLISPSHFLKRGFYIYCAKVCFCLECIFIGQMGKAKWVCQEMNEALPKIGPLASDKMGLDLDPDLCLHLPHCPCGHSDPEIGTALCTERWHLTFFNDGVLQKLYPSQKGNDDQFS